MTEAAASVGLGALSFVVLVVFFVAAAGGASEGAMGLIFMLPLFGTVIGLVLGMISRDRGRTGGAALGLAGIAINGLLLVLLVALACAGTFLES